MQTKTHQYLHETDLPELAREYAPLWLTPGTVVALHGDLGAGKTAFVRAFIREICGGNIAVPSPTFTLVQPYETSVLTIYHYDLYRLTDASELTELNWTDALSNGLVFVEWPERAGNQMPPHWRVEITDGDNVDTRSIKITLPNAIDTVMVLAAGLGTRMRPLTETTPKPLLKFAGRAMLDHVLDGFAAGGVMHAVVNAHYLGEQIIQHVDSRVRGNDRIEIQISDEKNELLDSGGAIKQALPLLKREVFFTANADAVWRDASDALDHAAVRMPALLRMMKFWNPDIMDTLLLLAPREQAVGFDGPGDYYMMADGKLSWRSARETAPYVYASVTISKASVYAHHPEKIFSCRKIWDAQETTGRLYGIVHNGLWVHCSTPADIVAASAALS